MIPLCGRALTASGVFLPRGNDRPAAFAAGAWQRCSTADFSLEQIDAARCDRLVQRERIDAGELRHRHEHFARDEPNAEVAAHSRKDLIDGLYLHVRTERQVVPQKEVGIEIVGRCSLGETDDGIRRASA